MSTSTVYTVKHCLIGQIIPKASFREIGKYANEVIVFLNPQASMSNQLGAEEDHSSQ